VTAWAPRVFVLGRGRVGRSLIDALKLAGIETAEGPGRAPEAVTRAQVPPDLVVLAVPDEAIEPTARSLAALPLDEGREFVHLSGALGLDTLAPLSAAGCRCGSFHPFQPFPVARSPEAFHGTTIGLTADDPGLARRLGELARRLGAVPREVRDDDRAAYHAAAMLASACVVALAGEAARVLHALGWSSGDATATLVPLMEGTVANIAANGLPDALSGPLRRGDADTVARHIGALEELGRSTDAGDVVGTYRVLVLSALRQARELGLGDPAARRIETLLQVPR
jgi:predicted short-subunit dehydrogenase-like oxidoreductase (DUF2520 family)